MKRFKKLMAICLSLALLAGALPIAMGTAALAEAAGTTAIQLGSEALGVNVNSSAAATVYYGQYNNAPIAWRVIGYNGSGVSTSDGTNGKAMLLSSEKLGMNVFYSPDPSQQNNNYAQSALRRAISNIASNGLTSLEQSAIEPRDLVAGSYSRMDPMNTDCIADPNNATLEDQLLWPLSTDEADDGYDGNGVAESIRALNPDTIDIDTDWWWWLRSPGEYNFAACVFSTGYVFFNGDFTSYELGVRPAFYLNLDSVLFTSAAEGGKSSGAEGAGALAEIPASSSTEYKLTLRDSGRNLQISVASAQTPMTPGGSVTVNYWNAVTGANESISAMIVNETSGQPVYYGRIRSLANASDATGSVTINIPAASNFSGGNYTLYVFNEQCNGDKMTDYASLMIAVASMSLPYTVTYAPGANGTGASSTASKLPGQPLTLAGVTFTREGYVQTGWATTDGGTKAYDLNGSYTADASITLYPVWTQNAYGISADPTSLDFGSQTEGYESAPSAQTVTISNTGNQEITLTQPTDTTNFTVGTLSSTTLAVNGTVTFSVQPKTGLGVGTYADTLIISGSNNVSASVGLAFTVTGAPTHAVTLNIRLDGAAYSGLTVALDVTDSAAVPAYALGESGAGAYTNNAVPAGTYYIYINGAYINRQFVNEQGGMWSMDYYTVRFDANGGTPAPESQVVLVGNAATEPAGVTMPDHTLEGWYNGEQRWDFASPVEQTLTLKANWTATAPQTYALTVVNGTGSGSYAAGAEVTIQADEAPTGMRFKEWQISPAVTFAQGGTNTATATIVMPGSAVTAVAAYETIPTELNIAVQPVDQYIVEGQQATFTIAATGDGVTYQWYINRNDGRGWRALDGATGPAYTTSVADLSCDGFQYACEVRDMYGNSLKSEIAMLHVSNAPVIPETGDSGRPGLYLAMLLAGGVGLIVLGKKRKRA